MERPRVYDRSNSPLMSRAFNSLLQYGYIEPPDTTQPFAANFSFKLSQLIEPKAWSDQFCGWSSTTIILGTENCVLKYLHGLVPGLIPLVPATP